MGTSCDLAKSVDATSEIYALNAFSNSPEAAYRIQCDKGRYHTHCGAEMMATFAEVFGVPAGHTLKEVRRHLGNYDDDWKHEEHDSAGRLVARYESWDHMPPREQRHQGWRKYDAAGNLLEEHEDLPL
jgi:hypothetical protein